MIIKIDRIFRSLKNLLELIGSFTNIIVYASKMTFTNGTKHELPETQTSA
ncbi:hypothetical protein IR022_05890 [Dysgonomonas sp. GY617]|nr:hypothetical protein [Dysgonomonas sp. GY617]